VRVAVAFAHQLHVQRWDSRKIARVSTTNALARDPAKRLPFASSRGALLELGEVIAPRFTCSLSISISIHEVRAMTTLVSRMRCAVFAILVVACGPSSGHHGGGGNGPDANGSGGSGGGGGGGDFTVYAHSDTILYSIDLTTKQLVTIGSFNAPMDTMTDLAVAPTGTIYTISKTGLYTVSPQNGAATKVASLSACGNYGVALTTTSDGRLWMGDYSGNICQIDISASPPVVKPPVMMQNGYALSGDMVGIGNGTVYGSAYKPADTTTNKNNSLVKVDVTTGAVTVLGPTGYPNLFGVAAQQNQIFGFTHDGSGRVVTIDPSTGIGTMYGTFMDPATNTGISFAGAGVNSMVVIQ
jgi:hypothetical protein